MPELAAKGLQAAPQMPSLLAGSPYRKIAPARPWSCACVRDLGTMVQNVKVEAKNLTIGSWSIVQIPSKIAVLKHFTRPWSNDQRKLFFRGQDRGLNFDDAFS